MEKQYEPVRQERAKKQYLKIPFEKRKSLIRLVEQEKFSIKKSTEILGIKYSTGKLIMKKFKQTGEITKFTYEKINEQKSQNLEKDNMLQKKEHFHNEQFQSEFSLYHENNENQWGFSWNYPSPVCYSQNLANYVNNDFFLWGQYQPFNVHQIYNYNYLNI